MEGWKKCCAHYLPNFQSSNLSEDPKHESNIETCLVCGANIRPPQPIGDSC